jgi:PTH1 family peptidyl-tRNA hydrolase
MRLIVGLGNTGSDYANTRHNVGWLATDYLAEQWALGGWRISKKLDSHIVKDIKHDSILAKPTTMMNNSGWTVRKLLDYYEMAAGDLVVIHDDADLGLGEIRESVATKTGAGHHGVLSVVEHVGPGFRRIRIGIGRPAQPIRDISGYVLTKFSDSEIEQLRQSFSRLRELI